MSKPLIAQAIDMIQRQDLSHWSNAHDRVTLAALREYRAVWSEPKPGQQWKGGNEFLPYHPQASHVRPDYRDGWNDCYRMAVEKIGQARREALEEAANTVERLRNEHCDGTRESPATHDWCDKSGEDGCEFVAAWNDAAAAIRELSKEKE